MKIGLVLEGGAMRGMYSAAVLDCMLDYGIEFDAVIGVSAGALFGVNFLSEQRGRALRYSMENNPKKEYMGLIPLLFEGNIVSTKYAYNIVPRELDPFDDETFKSSDTPFYAVVTDVDTGEPEYIRIKSVYDDMDILRASGSLPFVSKPVELCGRRYLDGGIADPIPYEFLYGMGCDKIVVILTRDMNYRKKPFDKRLVRIYKHRHAKLSEALAKRHMVYNKKVEMLRELETEGRAFVIRPSEPIKIARLERDPDKLHEVYKLGERDSAAVIDELRQFCGL